MAADSGVVLDSARDVKLDPGVWYDEVPYARMEVLVVEECEIETRLLVRRTFIDGRLYQVEVQIGGRWRNPLEVLRSKRRVEAMFPSVKG